MNVKKRYLKDFKDQWNQVVNDLLRQELVRKEKKITKLISHISEDFINSVATAFFDQAVLPRLDTLNTFFSLTNPLEKRFRLDYIKLTIENKKSMWIYYAVKKIQQARLDAAQRLDREQMALERQHHVEIQVKPSALIVSEGSKRRTAETSKKQQSKRGNGPVERRQDSLFNGGTQSSASPKFVVEKEPTESQEVMQERLRQQAVVESMTDRLPKFKKYKLLCTVTREDINILVEVLDNHFSLKA